ncbi:MAG: SurA N-terminal domain-containing protein [Candidatus Goldiibacteriota bacterium]
MKKIILMAAAVFLFAAGAVNAQEIAKVNGKKITVKDFEKYIENMPPQYKDRVQEPEVKMGVLENLIVGELLMQKAKKENLLEKSDVKKKVKERSGEIKKEADTQIGMLEKYGGEVEGEENGDEIKKQIKERINLFNKQKKNSDEIAKNEVVIKQMLENRKFKDIKVSNEEIKKQYDGYKNQATQANSEAQVPKFDEIKEDLRVSLARQKWLNKLKENADISIDENFVSKK